MKREPTKKGQSNKAPLLPEWEKNTVYLSSPEDIPYLKNQAELRDLYGRLEQVLRPHTQVRRFGTSAAAGSDAWPGQALPDVWLRDFAPMQRSDGSFLAFDYRPGYLAAKEAAHTQRALLERLPERFDVKRSPLVLDGGSVVTNGRGDYIVSQVAYPDNPQRNRAQIQRDLHEALHAERIAFVPAEPGDISGHVDGTVRWISTEVLVVNDCSPYRDLAGFQVQVEATLTRRFPWMTLARLPYRRSEIKHGRWWSAEGIYANFLQTERAVFLPAYGQPEDELAQRILENLLPGIPVVPVRSNAIARWGGVLNCITWTTREEDN
ncbi:MAG: agmatine deiminase family protein [Deltaproteobacteria bacterium]|nr:agmatine deiminase family protein [Deltaproteobacteria bacterium]